MERLLESLKAERRALEDLETQLYGILSGPTNPVQYQALVQHSEGWFRERSTRITASNFGIICELSKWVTARSLWQRITGKFGEIEKVDNEHTRRGNTQEDWAIQMYERCNAVTVRSCGLYLLPKPYEFLGATPDGLLPDEKGLIEIKCPARGHYDAIPEDYMAQIQGQLAICGRDYCDFCSYDSGMGLKVWRVYRSKPYWEWMLPQLLKFREDVLEDNEPPSRLEKPHWKPPPRPYVDPPILHRLTDK